MVILKNAKVEAVDVARLEIDRSSVLRYLGYTSGSEPQGRIMSLIDDYIGNVHQLLEPSYRRVVRNVARVKKPKVLVEGPAIFRSEVVAGMLEGCHKFVAIIATIGSYLEDTVCRLARDGLVLQASVLDAIGSDAVEKVADLAQTQIEQEANEEGLVVSRRFSPGYCDWDIEDQPRLFGLFAGDPVPVFLTDTCLMIPQKSISGIVGLGTPETGVDKYSPCKDCDKTDCRGRR